MARGAALTGSLVVHAMALAAIAGLTARGGSRPTSRPARPRSDSVAIELTAPAAVTTRRPPAAASRLPTRSPTPTPSPAPRPSPAGAEATAPVETTLQIEPGGGTPAAAAPGGDAGAAHGNGIGFGAGGAIASPVDTARLATPEPPKPSRARPPRLIWPTRQGEIGDQPLYVAHITVDPDGYVAAARLVQGAAGAGATDEIWRFRYDPALDDDGHPVAAVIDQPFLVR